MVSQVNQLAADLPKYQATLGDKIQSLRGVAAEHARAGVRGIA
jgi:hypothetical protein